MVEELRAQGGGLRSANARLREVVVGKDELLAGKEGVLANQDGLIEAQREQLGNYADTVRPHADRAQVQDQLVDAPEELIDRLTAENAELRRRLTMDSSNSCVALLDGVAGGGYEDLEDRASKAMVQGNPPILMKACSTPVQSTILSLKKPATVPVSLALRSIRMGQVVAPTVRRLRRPG